MLEERSSLDRIAKAIVTVRGQPVLLDEDLSRLYGVSTKALNQAVKRNADRFPLDFMVRLSQEDVAALRSQFVTSNSRGGRRHRPFAFTEQGVAMLSSVLRSARAVSVNIEIMRAFVALRRMTASNAELTRRLDELEARHDGKFRQVFAAIRQMMTPPASPRPRIGFKSGDD